MNDFEKFKEKSTLEVIAEDGYVEKHSLTLDDKIRFECQMCGNCCRNRDEKIVVNGVDLYYIARATGMTSLDAAKKFCDCSIGPTSGVLIFTLGERLDGSCKLMRNSHCTVQKDKPGVCALFPFGRLYKDNEVVYFLPDFNRCAGYGKGEERTLREYFSQFEGFERKQKEATEWFSLLQKVSKHVKGILKKRDKEKYMTAQWTAFHVLYDLDTSKDFLDAIEENEKKFDCYLESLAEKKHTKKLA